MWLNACFSTWWKPPTHPPSENVIHAGLIERRPTWQVVWLSSTWRKLGCVPNWISAMWQGRWVFFFPPMDQEMWCEEGRPYFGRRLPHFTQVTQWSLVLSIFGWEKETFPFSSLHPWRQQYESFSLSSLLPLHPWVTLLGFPFDKLVVCIYSLLHFEAIKCTHKK